MIDCHNTTEPNTPRRAKQHVNQPIHLNTTMSTERGSKKRKTRSSCSGIELASAFHALQKFRHTVTEDFGPDNTNLESIELDTEIDEDALAQLDGLKTRSRCSRIALTSVFHILQKFRSTITEDFGPNNTNLKNTELDTEINEDTLVQLDGLLQWMDAKIKISTKVRLCLLSTVGYFTPEPEPCVLIR